jgi:hypothetical protein
VSKQQLPEQHPYTYRGKVYDMRIEDVVRVSGRALRWVYISWEILGGVKRAWDGGKRETIRFNEAVVRDRLVSRLGVNPRSPREVVAARRAAS